MNFVNTYKKNFLLYLFFTQFILKGCLFYGIFNNFIFPLLTSLNVTPYQQQIYYTIMYSPWTFKPAAGLLIDGFIFFCYRKRFYQLMIAIIMIISSIILVFSKMYIPLLITGFFLMNLIVATLDIISESTYTEILSSYPNFGSKIISYVVSLQQAATLLMLILMGPLIDNNYYYLIILMVSILLIISTIPNLFNMINAKKINCPKIYCVKTAFESRWLVGISIYLLIFSLVYMVLSICSKDYYSYSIIGSMYVILLLLIFATFNSDAAKTLAFVLIYTTFNPSFGAQMQYHFTNENVIDGYNLSYTFYVTIVGIVTSLFGVLGSISYGKIYKNYSFRKIMLITNILTISTTLISVVTIYFKNLSNTNIYILSLIWASLYGIFSIHQFLWSSTFFSKNCEKGKETIMLSIYFGVFNLATSLGTYVSDQYYKFYLRFIGSENSFEHFYIYYFLLAFVLPIMLTTLLYKMVSITSETDVSNTISSENIGNNFDIENNTDIELEEVNDNSNFEPITSTNIDSNITVI